MWGAFNVTLVRCGACDKLTISGMSGICMSTWTCEFSVTYCCDNWHMTWHFWTLALLRPNCAYQLLYSVLPQNDSICFWLLAMTWDFGYMTCPWMSACECRIDCPCTWKKAAHVCSSPKRQQQQQRSNAEIEIISKPYCLIHTGLTFFSHLARSSAYPIHVNLYTTEIEKDENKKCKSTLGLCVRYVTTRGRYARTRYARQPAYPVKLTVSACQICVRCEVGTRNVVYGWAVAGASQSK